MTIVSGDDQTVTVGEELAAPVVVRVKSTAPAGAATSGPVMITIQGRAAPVDPIACRFAPGGPTLLGPAVLDVGSSPEPTYRTVLYVENLLPPTTASEATSGNAWAANAGRVVVNPPEYVAGATGSLLAFSADITVPVDGQSVPPAGGIAAQYLEAISGPVGARLAGLVAPGELRNVVLGVSLAGQTATGTAIESARWYLQLNLCNGCLAPPTCGDGQTLTATNCFGTGQDSAPVCSAAPAP